MSASVRSWLRARSERGVAEVSVLFVAASVVLGAVFGTGLVRTVVTVGDGVTWLADSSNGQVLEVNPATMRTQSSALVGAPGQELALAQERGRLVVANRSTGALTSIDLATLVASGRRDASPGQETTVLLDHGQAFLLDRAHGFIANIDPVTLETRGRVWAAPKGMRDATIDGEGRLWGAAGDGTLTRLTWSKESRSFVVEDTQVLEGVGSTLRLVAHDKGVTAVSPDTGAIIQVGTGRDLVAAAPSMRGAIAPANKSASTLVPVSVPGAGTVVIVSGDHKVREVATSALGCPKPGVPVALQGVVYVPCLGSGRVIRLDPVGKKAGPDVLTEGDAEIVLDDGALLVNVPGAKTGVRIGADGATMTFVRLDGKITPVDLEKEEKAREEKEQKAREEAERKAAEDREKNRQQPQPPTAPWTPAAGGSGGHSQGQGTGASGGTPAPSNTPAAPSPSTPSSGGTNAPAPQAPIIGSATSTGNGQGAVTWSQPGAAPTDYAIQVDGRTAATAAGGTTSAVLSGLAAGRTYSVVVMARYSGDVTKTSAAASISVPVVAAAPDAPAWVVVQEAARAADSATFTITWGAAPDNGSLVTSYAVSLVGQSSSGNWSGAGDRATVSLSCPAYAVCGAVTATVTATNGVGQGPGTAATGQTSAPPAPPLPSPGSAAIQDVVSPGPGDVTETTRTVTLRFTSAWTQVPGATCTISGSVVASVTVPCNSGQAEVQVNREGNSRSTQSSHTIHLVATNTVTSTSSQSADYQWWESWPPLFPEPW